MQHKLLSNAMKHKLMYIQKRRLTMDHGIKVVIGSNDHASD